MTRRDLLLGVAMVRAGKARAQSAVVAEPLFDIEQTSRRSWIALARPAAMLNCNAAIFELSNGLLVVDTHSKPSAAAVLVGQLRRVVDKPVRFIVNTHFHYDHAHGNAAYRKLAPQASILATRSTREKMIEVSARFVANSIESMRKQWENARSEAAQSSGRIRQHWLRMAAGAEPI